MKYQKAIEEGKIEGAAIEIQGRIDHDFLKWAVGEGLSDKGAIEDVEIIYSLPLPSGREYRFILKRGKGMGLQFENERSDYTMDDMIVIRGLAQSLRDKSITSVMEDVNIDPDVDHPLVTREHILHPENITDPAIFEAYNDLRLEGIWDRLTDKALEPPEKDKVSAYDERANREFVMNMLVEFQNFLNANPEVKDVKTAYVVTESQYDEVVDTAMGEIAKIRAYEIERAGSRGEKRRKVERDILGYKGPAEGYPLDVEHILMDSLQNVTKVGKTQSPRTYDDVSRFVNLKDLRDHLADEDRSYLEVTVYDPTKDHHNSTVITGKGHGLGQKKGLDQHERNLADENLKRAEARLEKFLKRHDELKKLGKEERDAEEETEYRGMQGGLSGYRGSLKSRFQRLRGELEKLEREKRHKIKQSCPG